jgi:RNA polymerase sigma-70 factor (ECF subfamily)
MSELPANNSKAGRPDVVQVVEHLFRHEAGKMVATLTRILGFQNLHLAEDVVQDALLKAMQNWAFSGIPRNPSAWLLQVARNQALDCVRRQQNFRSKEADLTFFFEQGSGGQGASVHFDDEIRDDQLRMMFACCHPALARETQVALTLKTLCGFGEEEIAAAFLTSKAAMAKRLVRARQQIREAGIAMEIPAGDEMAGRLDAVLQTLYLLFNEGYKASHGEDLVRQDLCEEAIRLTTFLAGHPEGNRPKTHALLSLMLLSGARLSARVDAEGNLLLLAEQDRSRWDRAMIQRGLWHLNQSAAGDEISELHLQAGIAYCHCTAASYEATDWRRILMLYDILAETNHSPVVALNRAVALSRVRGPEAGLQAVEQISDRATLDSFYLWHSVMAQFRFELGQFAVAAGHFERALELTAVTAERNFLTKRLLACRARATESGPAQGARADRWPRNRKERASPVGGPPSVRHSPPGRSSGRRRAGGL